MHGDGRDESSRRRFARNALILAAWTALPSRTLVAGDVSATAPVPEKTVTRGTSTDQSDVKPDETSDALPDVMDEALDMLAGTGPEFSGGLSNHGPMAAEALLALGRPRNVKAWVERYRRNLREHPQARKPIDRDRWKEALGDFGRVGDWIAFFDREIAEHPWPSVLNEWVPRLAPGFVAVATHGVIRTGHAVRSLGRRDTTARRHELAEGLGYWGARFHRLPESAGAIARGRLPSQAIGDVALLPPEKRPPRGATMDALRALEGEGAFAPVIGLVDPVMETSRFISDLSGTFARVMLEQTRSGGSLIIFIHAVTGPSAVRLLAPHLSAEATRVALRYAWQAGAALYAALGRQAVPGAPDLITEDRDGLIDRAVATGDEHAIKLTEACLREHAIDPRPDFLRAARHACDRLSSA